MNIITIIVLAAVAVVALYYLMKKYSSLEKVLFAKGDEEPRTMGVIAFYVAVALGAIGGSMGFIYHLATNMNIFELGFGSPLGIAFNIIPYLLFADIAVCFFLAFAREESTTRRVSHSLFMLAACLLGFTGGVVGSLLAICIAILAFLWKLLLALLGVKAKKENTEQAIPVETPTPVESSDVGGKTE
jgi:hypothetical protein